MTLQIQKKLAAIVGVAESDEIGRVPNKYDENNLDCSFGELEAQIKAVNLGWAQNLRHRHVS